MLQAARPAVARSLSAQQSPDFPGNPFSSPPAQRPAMAFARMHQSTDYRARPMSNALSQQVPQL